MMRKGVVDKFIMFISLFLPILFMSTLFIGYSVAMSDIKSVLFEKLGFDLKEKQDVFVDGKAVLFEQYDDEDIFHIYFLREKKIEIPEIVDYYFNQIDEGCFIIQIGPVDSIGKFIELFGTSIFIDKRKDIDYNRRINLNIEGKVFIREYESLLKNERKDISNGVFTDENGYEIVFEKYSGECLNE